VGRYCHGLTIESLSLKNYAVCKILSAFGFLLLAHMTRFVLFLLCFCFFIGAVSAQDNLTGRVLENKTNVILPGIAVKNLKTNYTTVSDRTGAFSIPVHVGDLVTFSSFAYQADTLYVKDLNYLEIHLLLKGTMLQEVKVTGQETRLGNLKAPPTLSPINSDALTYTRDGQGNYTGGITANIFDSHSAENKRKHEAQVAKDEGIKTKIAGIFSPEGLKEYLTMDGQEMKNFIILYTPDVATFTAPGFNLTLYINNSYDDFMKIPEEKRKSKELTQLKSN
jgi:hypothetical protein